MTFGGAAKVQTFVLLKCWAERDGGQPLKEKKTWQFAAQYSPSHRLTFAAPAPTTDK
jgi:hypothetical protein